ncbi:hypothetical protein FJV46_04645 [Arthrobacter agilis]|uniref:LysM peptidoglycan-binding domain-containing protein n=1 Tax=Arthrobacter agilis TaxID=37921 RepID=UPI000F71741C|nr:hypothetical protein [Arthrobacter agilis]TPV27099.1 hypothetical protein FJV46_04645 [Arthrobacter agilis]VDR32735.1 Uncharacterised protein [Arthrobacter agilis]
MTSGDAAQAGMLLGTGAVSGWAGQTIGRAHTDGAVWGFEALLGAVLSGVGFALVAWWILALCMAVLAEAVLRNGPSAAAVLAQRCTPALMRRLAVAALGVNMIAVPAVAQAAGDPPGRPPAGGVRQAAAPDSPLVLAPDGLAGPPGSPGWDMDTADGSGAVHEHRTGILQVEEPRHAAEDAEPTAAPETPGGSVSPAWKPVAMPVQGGALLRGPTRAVDRPAEVVVVPGDSLWSIVEQHLGPLATAADIAEAWPAWHSANKAVIGDNPCLLLPGQVLHAPPP